MSDEEKCFDQLPDFSQLHSQQTSKMISQLDQVSEYASDFNQEFEME